MKKTAGILLYVIVGLMCIALLLAIATAIYGFINLSCEDERGYMDGFRDGMLMHMDYGTIKLEGGEE